jgi:ketosteroid isomerase-like protein
MRRWGLPPQPARSSETAHGRDSHKEFLLAYTAAFNGERWTIETIVADEQTVASLVRARAKHSETGNPIDLRVATSSPSRKDV